MQEIKFNSPSVDTELVLYQIPEPVQGTIVKRPSQHCKTPYMADAIIHSRQATARADEQGPKGSGSMEEL